MKYVLLTMLVILSGMRFDSISPNHGKAGDSLTITGANFGSDCEITIGRQVTKIESLSSTEIKVVVPRHTPGLKSLSIKCKERMPIFQHRIFTYDQ